MKSLFCVCVCVHARCLCAFSVCEQGIQGGGGETVQRGVLREDTRGRVSARLCRLALTATDAGLK